MSVIVWDGKTLAADRMACMQGAKSVVDKLFLLDFNCVFGFTGPLSAGMHLKDLFTKGELFPKWPASQSTDDWCRVIIGNSDGKIYYTEKDPVLIPIYTLSAAWGSGRDFALGAMAAADFNIATEVDAVQAVLITSELCDSCGCGVTAFTYDNGKWVKGPR